MDNVDESTFEGCEYTKDEKRGKRRPWHVPAYTIIEIRRTLGGTGSAIDGITSDPGSQN